MKMIAVSQLLLLTVAGVSAAPPPNERHICSHGAGRAQPVELKQSNLTETRIMLDFDNAKQLEHDWNQEEKLEGEQRYQYGTNRVYVDVVPIGRDFGQHIHLQDRTHQDLNHHMKTGPNHNSYRMWHSGQSYPRNDQEFPVLEHGGSLHKRAAEVTPTTTGSQLDVLNPVDKVYDVPVPELKGGVRRRSVEGESTTTGDARIKWIPPPADMPVSEDYEKDAPKKRSPDDAHPQKVADKSITTSFDVPEASGPVSEPDDKGTIKILNTSESRPPLHHIEAMNSEVVPPKNEDIRNKRSTGTHGPPKAISQSSEVNVSTSARNDSNMTQASVPNEKMRNRSTENEESHHTDEESAPRSSIDALPSAPETSLKENAPRSRRSAENKTHEKTKELSASDISSSDESAPTTSVPKENSVRAKRSAEHEAPHPVIKEDIRNSNISAVTESATLVPKKEHTHKRRAVGNEELHQVEQTAIPSKSSSDEGASTTSASKENSVHVKRFAEHEGTHQTIMVGTPVSSTAGVTESARADPKKEGTRRRRSVESEGSIQDTTVGNNKGSDENAPSELASKKEIPRAKLSTWQEELHQAIKEDTPDSSRPSVTESLTSETKEDTRRGRSVGNEEPHHHSKSSSDEGASTTSASKENSIHVKRFAEHKGTHQTIMVGTPVSSTAGVTESARANPKKEGTRRRRSVESEGSILETTVRSNTGFDENAPSAFVSKKEIARAKLSPEQEELHQAIMEDTPESSTAGITESARADPKKEGTRRRRSVESKESIQGQETTVRNNTGFDENAPPKRKLLQTYVQVLAIIEDTSKPSTAGVTESEIADPKKEGTRSVESERSIQDATVVNNKGSDENAPSALVSQKEITRAKLSPEQEEIHQPIMEDTPKSSTAGVTESARADPKKEGTRRRRSVESEGSIQNTTVGNNTGSNENAPSALVSQKEITRAKLSPEQEKLHQAIKEDTPESSTAGVTESARADPKKEGARRRRFVESKESIQGQETTVRNNTGFDENAPSALVPKKEIARAKLSTVQEELHPAIKEDTPDSSIPRVTESVTETKKEGTRRRRSAENEKFRQFQTKASTSSAPELVATITEAPRKERSAKHERHDCQHEHQMNSPRASDPIYTWEDWEEHYREVRSAKDELQRGSTEGKVEKNATEEPILKKEVSRRRRAVENSKHVRSEHEGTHEETRDSPTTPEPAEEDVKRAADNAQLSSQTQVPKLVSLDEKKPTELQEDIPRSRVEALIMREERNCCNGRHPPGMHGSNFE